MSRPADAAVPAHGLLQKLMAAVRPECEGAFGPVIGLEIRSYKESHQRRSLFGSLVFGR